MAERHYHLKNIRTLLNKGFTDEELRRLCFDEPKFEPVYDQLARDTGKAKIIDLLLEHVSQKLHLETLLALAREHNPARYEEHQPYYEPTTSTTAVDVNFWKWYLDRVEILREFPNVELIIGYQNLNSTNKVLLREEVKKFVWSSSSLLIIRGHAGCGKSVFLQDFARQTAINLLQELEALEERKRVQELEGITENLPDDFQNPVPIFFSLNSFSIKPGESLGREILTRLIRSSPFSISETNMPERLFEERGKKWLILLDAFDEVERQNRSDVWSAIRQLVDSYPNVKVVVTVRPGDFSYKLPESARTINVAPLSYRQVIRYLKAQLIDDPEKKKYNLIFEFLSSESELWKHLRLPLFLQIAASYLSGGEIYELYDSEEVDPFWGRTSSTSISPVTDRKESGHHNVTGVDLDQIKALVSQELIDEADLPFEVVDLPSPDNAETPSMTTIEAPIRIGIFLDRVFHRLWKHNEKKRLVGIQLGGLDETYEALGEMAANMAERHAIRIREAKKYVNSGLYWILDLGILLTNKVWVSFPTVLSKTYFAAFFLAVSLESNRNELSNLIRGSPTFWEKCLSFVIDLTPVDVSPLTEYIEALKGEQIND